nr:putative reverse transcriptase domain-containing protein [Tanacetum cinerariifolium]
MQKAKKVKDSAYHKEKMLLCKQAKKGVPLQVEQYDWIADTDEEIDEQELEANYSYVEKIQEVPTAELGTDSEPLEQVQNDTRYNVFANNLQHYEKSKSISNTCIVKIDDSNVISDSPDMCDNDIQNDQNDVECDDERVKHTKDQFRAPTSKDMDILIKTCLMPLALKTQNDSFIFIHELKQEMHADLKTKKPNTVPISTRKPKGHANKSVAAPRKKKVASKSTTHKPKSYYRMLFEKTSKAWKWWIKQQCPSGYKWVPKTKMQWMPKFRNENVQKRVSFAIDNASRITNHMTGNLKLLCNFVEKYMGTVRFGNDQFAPILKYRDLVQGNITINKGNDLLTDNHGYDLYIISLQESTSSTPLCLMAKASPTQAWLWHRTCRSPVCSTEVGEAQVLGPELIQETTEKIVQIKQRMQAACDRQKSYTDLKRKPMEFQVGYKVMLKLLPWKGVVRFGKREKLNPRYVGPFKVFEIVGDVAYKLDLPEELSKVHNTFHVSNLKNCHANEPLAVPLDGLHFDDKIHLIEEPVEIMDREVKWLKRSRIPLVKVRWNSKRGPDFTWEREDQFRKKYPHLFAKTASSSSVTS